MTNDFIHIAAGVEAATAVAAAVLRARREPEVNEPVAPGNWSAKQILGHLVDSAANNHQRFVRAQLVDHVTDPGYQQDAWVAVQGYQDARWTDLLDLWTLYNRHLAHVIRRIPMARAGVSLQIGAAGPETLSFVASDYLRHLRHHLRQLGVAEP